MSKDNGGQAFPSRDFWDESQSMKHEHGMTLRDWFAGQALTHAFTSGFPAYPDHKRAAREAYNLADAMLAARKC